MKRKLPRSTCSGLVFGFVISLLIVAHSQTKAQGFPSGFSRVTVTTGMVNNTATAMDFAPDGRIFVVQKDGRVRIIKNGSLLATSFATMSVNQTDERGLGGIVLDPNFATNGYVYLYYTIANGSANRISRVTANGDVMLANSQVNLLDIPTTGFTIHNGGAMKFKGGYLYVAVGDHGISSNAQSKDVYYGKILRLNSNGTPAVGNPFFNDTGANNARKSIWTMGHRNPFTFDVSETGTVYVNDVGPSSREEINDATTAGGNYGWPNVTHGSSGSGYVTAAFSYLNSFTPIIGNTDQGCAISGGVFVDAAASNYPPSHKGKYFYIDWCNNWINYIDPITKVKSTFGSNLGADLIGIDEGIDGNLYYLQNGVVYKIMYTNTSAPAITNNPVSISVAEGQPASFTISASGATPLTIQWQKSGVDIPGANALTYTIPSVSASQAGQYRAKVTNSFGTAFSTYATLTVLAYNAPPVAQIVTPSITTTYSYGDIISYSGNATDTEDGSLPASAFTWSVDFHHNTHSHPSVGATGTKTGSFECSYGEPAANVWYRLTLIVKDSQGLADTAVVNVYPKTSTVNLATQPSGLRINLNGSPDVAPYSALAVEKFPFTLGTDQYQTLNGTTYEFSSWQHGGTMNQNFTIPVNDVTYTAVFVPSTVVNTTLNATKDAYVRDGANAATNYGATDPTKMETKLDATANSGFNREAYLGFDLATIQGEIATAQIRVYGNLGGAGLIPVGMHSVSNLTWTESTINWNNKPTASTAAVSTADVNDVTGKYYTWDVTNYVKTEKVAGRNLVSFNMKNTVASGPQTVWSSKEGANAPQMVITSLPAATTQSPYGGTALTLPGKIEAENYDFGGQNVAYFDTTPGNSGATYRTDDVDVQAATEGGYNIGYAAAGEWTEYTVNVTASGNYNFEFRVVAIATGKSMHLEVDGVNITGAIAIPVGTSWQDFKSVTISNIPLTQGQKVLRIIMDTPDQNINYVNVTTATTSTDPLTLSYYFLTNKLTAGYMRPTGGVATAAITQYQETTMPTFDSYRWEFIASPTSGYYYIINKYTRQAIQPTGGSLAENTGLSQVPFTGQSNDEVLWALETSNELPFYWIKNKKSGLYIRPANGTTGTGIAIVQNTLNSTYSSFKWNFVDQGLKPPPSARVATRPLIEELSEEMKTTVVYPNPTSGMITVVTEVGDRSAVSISIYDMSGKQFLSKEFKDVKGHFEKNFDLSAFPSGEFVLKIQTGNTIESRKVIKN